MYHSIFWCIPFIGILVSVALLPLVVPAFWHKHCAKVIAFWVVSFLMVHGWIEGIPSTLQCFFQETFHHYIPFIALISALFVVSSGIHISMRARGTPFVNAGLLAMGAFLSNFIGTTGAAMLLVRPLMRINLYRRTKTHIMIFFIFIVCNVGGCLSPLGDPPLFLGFLEGVPFSWPFYNFLKPLLALMGVLLLIFIGIDFWFMRHDRKALTTPPEEHPRFRIQGMRNVPWLLLITCVVVINGLWENPPKIWGVDLDDLVCETALFVIAFVVYRFTPKHIFESNHFTFDPLKEVAVIFAGIFITAAPVIALLHLGDKGPFSGLYTLMNPDGAPHNLLYFWITGALSSFLDNAPTYLVFFHMAGGDVVHLTTHLKETLTAISLGAVFMGAMTYIGNAPNFMVKSLAEASHIRMPSFFTYMAWSVGILLPLFMVLSWVLWK